MTSDTIRLYDTTLRDGTQREGLSLSVEDKVKIALKLDELGVHYIEGGFPGSNPKDLKFFRRMKDHPLRTARLVAFGSTRRKNTLPEEDPGLEALIEAGTPAACIFGKSWDAHVYGVLVTTLDENLAMISDSVRYLKEAGLEVVYDAEHFFDGYAHNREYALATLKAAEQAGADWIVLCDTNGGTLPSRLAEVIREIRPLVKTPWGIHAHNDAECAVANSLVAVEEGCAMVHGTMNGYGERCGNANLSSVIPNLVLKLGVPCLSPEGLARLTEVSHFVSDIANITPDPHQPFVGQSAFAHKGGVHVSAVVRQQGSYEHIDPGAVGNEQRFLVSELSGTATIVEKARELAGVDLSDNRQKVAVILSKLKKREQEGYHFEAADGTFALFILKNIGAYRPLFETESYEVRIDRWPSGNLQAEAIVKLRVGGKREVVIAEGKGPVNALDRALRKALEPLYPSIASTKLTDFKVRALGQKRGTASVVRVLIETTDGERTWGSVGVSENIIEASWQALVDGIEYGLLPKVAPVGSIREAASVSLEDSSARTAQQRLAPEG